MYSGLVLVFLFTTRIKGLHIQGPSGPLETQLGASLLLPCFTQNPLPLEGLQVEWRKTESDSLVNIFQQGESKPQLQSKAFRGRVHFFPDEIPKGNFSISLQNVAKNDIGVYRCKVDTAQDFSETSVEITDVEHLVVTGSDHALSASVGDEVVLNCSVDTNTLLHQIEEVSWKRTDRDMLILLYQTNKTYPESSHESYQGRVEFFDEEIPKGNFSLKLKNVKTEDKGEYMCEVHTKQSSAHAVLELQKLGFSGLQKLILVLCFAALLLSLGLGVIVFILLKSKVTSEKVVWMIQVPLILSPNICMFAGFILWSTEGFLSEVVICSVITIMLPLMLMKTCPNLNKFPRHLANTVKTLAIPVYYSFIMAAIFSRLFHNRSLQELLSHINTVLSVIALLMAVIAAFSAHFANQLASGRYLEFCNGLLLCSVLTDSTGHITGIEFFTMITFICFGLWVAMAVRKYYFQRIPFECRQLLMAVGVLVVYVLGVIVALFIIKSKFGSISSPWIVSVIAICTIGTILLVSVLRCKRCQIQCCAQQKVIGYWCCTVVTVLLITGYGAACLLYINENKKYVKDYGGQITQTLLMHVLAASAFFQHPASLPDLPHIIIHMFGAVGLNIVRSITLASELIMKVDKGTRTIEDLRVAVLPFEIIFVAGWLVLLIYNGCITTNYRLERNPREEHRENHENSQEMQALQSQ